MDALPLAIAGLPRHVTRRDVFRRLVLTLPVFLAVGAAGLLIQPAPRLASTQVHGWQPLDAPLVVEFSWPVSRAVDVSIVPHVEGQVSYSDAMLQNRLVRTLTFTPDRTWLPGTTYTLALAGVKSATGVPFLSADHSLTFTTAPVPAVASLQPHEGSTMVADGAWSVAFERPLDTAYALSARLDPPVPVQVIVASDRRTATIQPSQLLGQGSAYTLHVERTTRQFAFGTGDVVLEEPPHVLVSSSWQVRVPPGVTKVAPSGTGVPLTESMALTFAEPVDLAGVQQNVTITPALEGAWESTDEHVFTFQPSAALAQATTYTITIHEGLRTKSGGVFEADTRAQFRTQEPVALASSSPASGATGVGTNRTIRLTFNQEVDREAALQGARVTPSVEGTWAWENSELTFSPKGRYAFGTTYTVTLPKGLAAVHGFPASETLTVTFTTEQATTRLAVPFHRQQHKLSCEIATLVMALRFHGVDIGEQPIIDAIGFDPTPKKNGVWGDPDVAFVGNIDGQQVGTGYGVYAAPIARVGSAYRPSRVMTGSSLTDILTEVQAGHPVIVWGNASTGQRVDWKTPTGKTVRAIVGEHTRVVVGYVGSVTSPTTIITLDPLFGERRFSRAAFLTDWARLGNMAVVVE